MLLSTLWSFVLLCKKILSVFDTATQWYLWIKKNFCDTFNVKSYLQTSHTKINCCEKNKRKTFELFYIKQNFNNQQCPISLVLHITPCLPWKRKKPRKMFSSKLIILCLILMETSWEMNRRLKALTNQINQFHHQKIS